MFLIHWPGPPPVPPRVDLGETEDTLPSLVYGEANSDNTELQVSEDAHAKESTSVVDQPVSIAPKPSLNPPIASKATKPKNARGRPEISIVSACPMSQSNAMDQHGIPTQNSSTANNNSLEKTHVEFNETKKTRKPPPGPPGKPPSRAKIGDKKASSLENLAFSRITHLTPEPEPKKGINKSNSLSVFYVDNDVKPGQVLYSKTNDSVGFKAAPKKTKTKSEQQKKTLDPPVSQNQSSTIKTKLNKLKPTIITAKKPKETKEVQESAPSNSTVSNKMHGSVNISESDANQPQRPKAPPNSTQDTPQIVPPKKEQQTGMKNEQKKSKPKPTRPPMSKNSVKNRPSRPAPEKPRDSRAPKSEKVQQQQKSTQNEEKAKIEAAHAIAKFDYTSDTGDDLNFKVGDTIMLISKVDDDWFVGYLDSNVMHQGLFPSSFVDVIIPLDAQLNNEVKGDTLSSEPHAVALHDFQGQSSEELSFSKDQKIILIERINQEWLKGKINHREGIFPQNFVQVMHDLPDKVLLDQVQSIGRCRAIHDYHGNHEDDLTFVVGDEIEIIERLANDWLRGVLMGKNGIFPASFVELIPNSNGSSQDSAFVTAIHDYPGESADDLSFKTGARIRLVEKINAEWLLGELNGKEGLFPVSFVDHVPNISHNNLARNNVAETKSNAQFAKAIHDFFGEHEGELQFKTGDLIEVQSEIDSNWCEGSLNGVTGIFPTSFVEMNVNNAQHMTTAKALHDFDSDNPEDLTFKAGNVIEILGQLNHEWWTGSLHGKTGQFPATFVQLTSS